MSLGKVCLLWLWVTPAFVKMLTSRSVRWLCRLPLSSLAGWTLQLWMWTAFRGVVVHEVLLLLVFLAACACAEIGGPNASSYFYLAEARGSNATTSQTTGESQTCHVPSPPISRNKTTWQPPSAGQTCAHVNLQCPAKLLHRTVWPLQQGDMKQVARILWIYMPIGLIVNLLKFTRRHEVGGFKACV